MNIHPSFTLKQQSQKFETTFASAPRLLQPKSLTRNVTKRFVFYQKKSVAHTLYYIIGRVRTCLESVDESLRFSVANISRRLEHRLESLARRENLRKERKKKKKERTKQRALCN
ncbi:hypothetical protein PUN28_000477 [Cardiocondyla obscurior]|uniref:Uncharacterized protein n=1 Tax=Cardiocondyla obscurior TaxID=286306 RepID=A0AAW2H054_9HYME